MTAEQLPTAASTPAAELIAQISYRHHQAAITDFSSATVPANQVQASLQAMGMTEPGKLWRSVHQTAGTDPPFGVFKPTSFNERSIIKKFQWKRSLKNGNSG
jgi:hypothetical protein